MKVKTKPTVHIELSEEGAHQLAVILSTFTLNAQENLVIKTTECKERVDFSIELEKKLAEFR